MTKVIITHRIPKFGVKITQNHQNFAIRYFVNYGLENLSKGLQYPQMLIELLYIAE